MVRRNHGRPSDNKLRGEHIEEVLDWRPFDYLPLATLLPIPVVLKVILTYAFLENASGVTHIEIHVAKPKPKDKAFLKQVGRYFKRTSQAKLRPFG